MDTSANAGCADGMLARAAKLLAATILALLALVPLVAEAQAEGTVVQPLESWTHRGTLMCDWNTSYVLQSPWPGDSPHDVLQQWVDLGNQMCSGVAGNFYVVSYTLNPCTPNIIVASDGSNPRGLALANGCTYRRHVTPKPNCSGTCQPSYSDQAAPTPIKTCTTLSNSNGSQFTLTSAPTYGECMCPAGSAYVTHNGTSRCVPIIKQTRKPPDMCAGNPIHPATGNKRQTDVDYVGNGIAPLTFSRTYNSASTFDQKWTSNFHLTTTWASSGSYATHLFHRPEGSYPFTFSGGIYVPDVDVPMVYSNGYLYLSDGNRVEHYTATQQMDEVRTRAFTLLQTLTYSTTSTPVSIAPFAGLLIKIGDAFGHALNLTYNAQGRMATMTDPGGGVYQYAYDGNGNLRTVTYPDGAVREYVYNEPAHTGGASLPNVLTGIIDESNQRYATFGYNASGLAVLTEHAGGADRYTVSYASAPSVASDLVLDGSNNVKYLKRYYQPPSSATLTDGLGQARQYTFAQSNGSTKTTGSDLASNGSCSTIPQARSFDANGNQSATTDFNGNTTTYVYDLTRNLETSRTEASGTPSARTITTQWHWTFRLPTQIDEPGKRSTFTYDSNGNRLTRTIRDNATSTLRTWTYTYNSYGQVLTENGPRTDVSDVTTYAYYGCATGYQCGQAATITNAAGHVTTFNTYNAHGQPLTITDPNGLVTTLAYDLRRRLTSRTVGAEQTTFEYWPTGLLKKTTLPDSSFLSYTYDAAHRLTGVADSEGNHITYTLDAMGNRTAEEVFDPSNGLTQTRTRAFNDLNRLWKELGAAGTAAVTTTFGYDDNGNQTTIEAPLNRDTTQGHDELNRLTQVTDPLSGVTQYGYNALDQLISVTDPRSKVTSYTYNAFGDLKQQVSPDTGTTTNTYDSGGNLLTSMDARGKTGTYAYDALNRVTSLTYPDQTITYTYDSGTNQKGRLTQVTDNSGSTSWTYDTQGRVLSRQQTMGAISKTVGYAHDASGRLQTLTLPSGNSITYGYSDGKISSLTLNGSTTILSNVLYQPFGPTRGWTWGNSTLAVREYDLDGKITDIDGAGLKTYSYDDAFRITGITDTSDSSLSQTYGYDLLDRLTSATGTILNQGWTYDANGNRLAQTGTQPSTFSISGTSNRLSSVSGTLTRSYGYDAAGNTTGDGAATFAYNDAGRMVSATKASVTSTYALNALGQRVRKTASANSTYFIYDESGHLIGEYDSSGALIQETMWFGDTPVAMIRPNGAGFNLFYVHADHLNTPRRISRSSDNVVVWRWDSDPFGTSVANEDPDGGTQLFASKLRFPGQYFDAETGLHYNYFRDGYDSAVGRYTQSDPMGLWGGLNTYLYADASPISKMDPTGENPAVRAAWWGGTRIGGAINYGVQAATGASIGSLIYDMCNESEEEKLRKRCQALKDSILSTCYGLQGRKRMACFEAANTSFRQCMGWE